MVRGRRGEADQPSCRESASARDRTAGWWEAHAAQARGERERAERLLASICRDDPAEPRHLSELMDFYFSIGAHEDAVWAARDLMTQLRDSSGASRSPVLAGHAAALLGDVLWLEGREDEARQRWRDALQRPGQ